MFESYAKSGKTREMYMQRLEREFKSEDFTLVQLDELDMHFEHKRW